MRGGAKRRAPPYRAEGDADQDVVEVAEQASMEAAALAYAAGGLPVFPLIPRQKEPDCARGFYNATTNPATIRRHWRVADRNIGIPTGAISGFWVLDVDPGGDVQLQRLEEEYGVLPPARAILTGRGGRHLWFKYAGAIQCSASRVAPGIDVRGDGGYVVAPPSVHENGRPYRFLGNPKDELAVAPDWLIALTRKRTPTISERAVASIKVLGGVFSSGAYGKAALDAETAALTAVLPGGRNHALNRAAFVLFQLVAGGELDGGAVEQRLVAACQSNGLIKDDGVRSVMATIRSGARAGLQYPRSRSGRLA
jgi:hypothetical protein